MVDQEMLEAMRIMMKEELKPVNARLDSIDERVNSIDERVNSIDERVNSIDERVNSIDKRLSNVEEDVKITRGAVNTLLEWAEEAQVQIGIPLFKKAE